MAHIGWFFAGTSLGLIVGVLLTSMAKLSEMFRGDEEQPVPEAQTRPAKLILIRR